MDKCACRGSFLDRFVQPSILMVLAHESLHGFSILKRLYQSDVMDYSSLDPTGLYRTLKKMEEAGLLVSALDTENPTQPKRIFTITEEGRVCLIFWKDTLLDYMRRVEALAASVDEAIRDYPELRDEGSSCGCTKQK